MSVYPWDVVVVGAGLSGVTAARVAAEAGKKTVVVEKRSHIAGNAYDAYNEAGILVHQYGPHIFHTNDKGVWDFLSRFTKWSHYQHRVLAYVEGQYVPVPINLDTVNLLFGAAYERETVESSFFAPRREQGEAANARDMVVSQVGEELYRLFFRGYTYKQWGVYPEELDAKVTARVPTRTNRDGRYFSDRYQGMPLHGYTGMIQEMLNHPNISVLLQTDYFEKKQWLQGETTIYTGPVDQYFECCYGALPYRSLRFEWETHEVENYQPAAVVNYPNDYDFTRVTEFKQLTGQKHSKTCIIREFSCAEGEPYYPMPTQEAGALYEKYREKTAALDHVYFLGRLGKYKYANMDVVVKEARELAQALFTK